MDNYLKILEESLLRKIDALEQIQAYNEKQKRIFESEAVDMEAFDADIEEKGKLIEQIERLDAGFEALYAKVAEELKENRAQHAELIKTLQQLVQRVTDMSVTVQAQEARNKALIEQYFAKTRKGLQQSRKSSKAAFDYYKSMSNSSHVPPQFMDSKK